MLQPNICNKGRRLRAILGVALLFIAAAFACGLFPVETHWLRWTAAGALAAIAAFSFFEAQIGWCAVRAMGTRTRL